MSHKCLGCGKVYEDKDPVILKGCECGSLFFVYFRSEEDQRKIKEIEVELEKKKTSLRKELEKKFLKRKFRVGKFDVETVKVKEDGVYEINLDALMERKPLVILEKGRTYLIHLPSVFEKVRIRE